jgi:uncharacterized membrane protein
MENKKLTWWQFINQDRTWILLFIVGFLFLNAVIIFDRIDPFYSISGFLVALAIPSGIMISVGYFIFYKGWKKYLSEQK